jgi:hypothetical protein
LPPLTSSRLEEGRDLEKVKIIWLVFKIGLHSPPFPLHQTSPLPFTPKGRGGKKRRQLQLQLGGKRRQIQLGGEGEKWLVIRRDKKYQIRILIFLMNGY